MQWGQLGHRHARLTVLSMFPLTDCRFFFCLQLHPLSMRSCIALCALATLLCVRMCAAHVCLFDPPQVCALQSQRLSALTAAIFTQLCVHLVSLAAWRLRYRRVGCPLLRSLWRRGPLRRRGPWSSNEDFPEWRVRRYLVPADTQSLPFSEARNAGASHRRKPES
jgi:hypothetical protein